jgi:quercetin dioxygenase-like cupin family protein
MIKRRDLVDAITAAAITLACVSVAQQPGGLLDSTAWKWQDLPAKRTDVGELRAVVRQPTRTLDELEMHITTLNPHTASHKPHTHPNEEMVILKEGTLQAHVNGKEIVVGPGSVLFFASMQPHAVQNIGDTPATYFVINWASAAAGTKKIPTPPSGNSVQ